MSSWVLGAVQSIAPLACTTVALSRIVLMWLQIGQTWDVMFELLEGFLMLDSDADSAALYVADVAASNPATVSSLETSISLDLLIQKSQICTSTI